MKPMTLPLQLLREPTAWLRRWRGPMTEELRQDHSSACSRRVPARLTPEKTVSLICGFCSTGCSLDAHMREGEPINLSPTSQYPVNLGMACPKGWEALTPLNAPDRAVTPLLRNAAGKLQPVTWDAALATFRDRFQSIQARHGAESVAWLGTGQMTTEELALLGALGKFGMGMIHGDGNTRQCMATAATAYKQSFGFDAPPFTYADFEASDVLVLFGSNLAIAHPILWQRVLRNPRQPEIIVIDPRATETAMAATQHYAIQPKSDLVLLYGLARWLIAEGWVDEAFVRRHTRGFEEFADFVRSYPIEVVSEHTGLSENQFLRLARAIRPKRDKAISFWWTMGINQGHQSTRAAQAIINLALMTGQIGRPGTGANSITGQCNAMGSRLFSNTTSLVGGYEFTNPEHRRHVAQVLDIPETRIPDRNSLAYDQILDGIETGLIKGLWIVATNPAHSWIEQGRIPELFRKLEFLVVQDMYHSTETCGLANLVLPAAAWGEKDGTFINSERRIGRIQRVATPPGQALSDFEIFRKVAEAWGCQELLKEWTSPEAVFQILKRLSRGRPCDISGIRDYDMIEACGGIQWPCPDQVSLEHPTLNVERSTFNVRNPPPQPSTLNPQPPAQERRLFADGRFFTPDGKAVFHFETPRFSPEQPDEAFPFLLLTGRGTSAQWHTQTRTGKSAILRQLYPRDVYLEMHPEDVRAVGARPQSLVRIHSRRAVITARIVASHAVQRGQVFLPMHYDRVNQLTLTSVDPLSRQPNYKFCAVRVEPMNSKDGTKRSQHAD